MRSLSKMNRALLCVNILLCVSLLFVWLVPRSWWVFDSAATDLPIEQAVLGVEKYYEKGPFVLLVGNDFPRDESFVLTSRDGRFCLSLMDTSRLAGLAEATRKTVSVDVGDHFSLSCDYSLVDDTVCPREMRFHHQSNGLVETLTDLNADGTFDVRQTRDEKRGVSHMYVLCQGIWREVGEAVKGVEQDKYRKRLVEGEAVSFDRDNGQWLRVTDERVDGKEK